MSIFKEYLRECITENKDIDLEEKHFGSVTFEDVCMVIHFITTTNKQIQLGTRIALKIYYADNMFRVHILLEKLGGSESLAILVAFAICKNGAREVTIHTKPGDTYTMSGEFIRVAKICGIYEYPVTKNLISKLCIKYEYSTEEGASYLGYYLGGQTKSARNCD